MPREGRAILRLAVPLAMSDVGTIVMACTDSAVVGRAGASPLAALGFASAYLLVVLALLIGTIGGVAPLIARSSGANEAAAARRLARAGIWLSVALSPVAIAALLSGRAVAQLAGVPSSVVAGAGTYLEWLAPAAPAFLLFGAAKAALDGCGHTRATMVVTIAGVLINAALVVALVPRHGMAGAAIATSAVRWAMAVAIMPSVGRELGGHSGEGTRAISRSSLAIARVGLPIGLHWSLEMAVFAVAAVFAGRVGVAALAAWQIAVNAVQTVFFVSAAIASAGAIRLGQTVGAGERRAMVETVRFTYRLVLGVAVGSCVVFIVAARPISSLYSSDPGVLALAAPCFIAAGLFTIVDQLQGCALTLLHGLADTAVAAAISVGGSWLVGIPLAWFFSGIARGPGVRSAAAIWAGLGVGVAIVAVAGAWRLRGQLLVASMQPT